MTKKPVAQPQDKYVLRLPDGLRDRIKAYAERRATSINSEIVRVLEREFPVQWPFDERLKQLGEAMSVLSAGKDDPRVMNLVEAFKETVAGIVSGRVTGVPVETREAVKSVWEEYQEREAQHEIESFQPEYDEEEMISWELVGRPEKYAVPPEMRRKLENLTDEGREGYILGYRAAKEEQRRSDNLDDDPRSETK